MEPNFFWLAGVLVIITGFALLYAECPVCRGRMGYGLERPSKKSAFVAFAVGVAIFIAEITT